MYSVTCPNCGNRTELKAEIPTVGDFCRSCDLPLFLVDDIEPATVASVATAERIGDKRRSAGVMGLDDDKARACWFCEELNHLGDDHCWRCGRPLERDTPPGAKREYLELPEEEPPTQEKEDIDPKEQEPVVWAVVAAACLLVILTIISVIDGVI